MIDMTWGQINKYFFVCCIGLIALSCNQTEAPQTVDYPSTISKAEIKKGQHLFEMQCARCHGMSGAGGSAPSLRRLHLTKAPDDATLRSIILNGIPGTEMPGTWLLSTEDSKLVAAYVRSIGKVENNKVGGEVDAGEGLFFGKGGCQLCHIINGEGGSLGPDLTRVGARRSMEFLKRSLLEPGFYKKEGELANSANGFITNLVYRVKTKDGVEISGMRVNEDAFTIQLRDAQNRFHSFQKKDLEEVHKEFEKSLMPSVKGILNETEVNHLVAYLTSLK